MTQRELPEAIGPILKLLTIVLPWLAGPLIVRIPESGYLLQTIGEQQFWFYTLTASCFGFITCILQGVYDKERRTGVMNSITYVITFIALVFGFSLAVTAVQSRLAPNVFLLVVGFACSLMFSQVAQRRKFSSGIIVATGLMSFLAAALSIIIFSGSIAWPIWIISLSFAAPLISKTAYSLKLKKLADASLVLMPILIAWLVSLTMLPMSYLLLGGLYAIIIPLLNRPKDAAFDAALWNREVGKISALFVVLLLVARIIT